MLWEDPPRSWSLSGSPDSDSVSVSASLFLRDERLLPLSDMSFNMFCLLVINVLGLVIYGGDGDLRLKEGSLLHQRSKKQLVAWQSQQLNC